MKTLIKLPFTLLIRYYYKLFPKRYRIDKWKREGKPAPPPREIKIRTIKLLNKKFSSKIFIETGTYLGDTTFDLRNLFQKLYTIELSNDLYKKAQVRFEKYKNIHTQNGDSGVVIKEILQQIYNRRILFWLDGHYSEGITAKSELVTPILNELISIRDHEIKNGINHIILIDDAHLFTGSDDYPELNVFLDFCKQNFPTREAEIINNIIVIKP
jgi:hypothetical protein